VACYAIVTSYCHCASQPVAAPPHASRHYYASESLTAAGYHSGLLLARDVIFRLRAS